MKLTIKNRIQQALQKLLDRSDEAGGIPDVFLSSKKEFGQLLVELNKLGSTNTSVTFGGNNPPNIIEIYRQQFTNESVNDLIRRWVDNDYTVKFVEVPIVYSSKIWEEEKPKVVKP